MPHTAPLTPVAVPPREDGFGQTAIVYGAALIGVLFVAWSWLTAPTPKDRVAAAREAAIEYPSQQNAFVERFAVQAAQEAQHVAEMPAAAVADAEQVQATLRPLPEPATVPPPVDPEPSKFVANAPKVRGRVTRFE